MYPPDTPPPKYYVLICCDTLGSECCYAKIRRIILLQFLWSSSGRELWESFADAILIVRILALQIGIMSHYVVISGIALLFWFMKIMIIPFIGKSLFLSPFLSDRKANNGGKCLHLTKGENREKCLSCLTKCSDNKKDFLHWFRALKHPRQPRKQTKKQFRFEFIPFSISIFFFFWFARGGELMKNCHIIGSPCVAVARLWCCVSHCPGDPVKGILLWSIEFHGPPAPSHFDIPVLMSSCYCWLLCQNTRHSFDKLKETDLEF